MKMLRSGRAGVAAGGASPEGASAGGWDGTDEGGAEAVGAGAEGPGAGGAGEQASHKSVTARDRFTMYPPPMSRFLFTVLLLFTTLAAAGQTPVVVSVQPPEGPADGGTTVTLTGSNLSTPVQCILPCPPQVVFGGVAVDAREESDSRLVVTTPAHVPGVVDVEVNIAGRPRLVLPDAFTFLGGADAGYEQVLLPIYIRDAVDGANGSRWKTDFRIRNDGNETVQLAPWECPINMACPPVFPLTYFLEGGRSLHNPENFAVTSGSNPSRLLYISEPSDVSMSLRVADVSRGSLNAGTDLPVIRASELLTGNAQLLNVPMTDPNFRVLVRLYDVAYSQSAFTVRLFRVDADRDEAIHTVVLNATTPYSGPFRSEAAYAQLDITGLLVLRKAWPEALRVEIEPRTPGSRYWAFASVTNNTTQLVTLVTPQ